MKKIITICKFAITLCAFNLLFQGCLKDSATRTYTLYSPVYKPVLQVRADIKSGAPTAIAKPGKIVVLGNYIFLNETDKGVHVIDNTNPSAPVNKYFIAIPGSLDLAVKGNTLYADLYKDLVTIDISNPAAVSVKKITVNVFAARQYPGFFNFDTTRVIVDWVKKDTTVTIASEPFNYSGGIFYSYSSSALQSVAAPLAVGVSGSTARFTLLSDYLYTVSGNALNVFDISQTDNPIQASQQNLDWQIETIFPFKNNLFIGSQNGVYIFTTSNPAKPSLLSTFGHATICDPVIADGNFAFVTLHDGVVCHGTINELDVLDISNIAAPRYVKTYPLTSPHGLSKDGNTLFICDGAAGLKVFDATNVYDLKLLQTIGGINASDVITIGNNAIVVTTNGLYQYDYTDRKQVTLKSKITYGL